MKERILTSLIAAIVLTGLQAQTASPVPRLVVGLTIDQLRSDYIEAFSALYGEKGFKRLMKEGRVYCNAGEERRRPCLYGHLYLGKHFAPASAGFYLIG